MRRSRFVLTAIAFCLAALSLAGPKWYTSYADAVKESARTKKPIMADFTGSDWCGWCIRLHKEVFDTPAFATWAAKNVVLLELDYPNAKPQSAAIKKQNADLQKKYNIQGYPTILFLDAKGKVLAEYGYDEGGPANWTKKAAEMIKKRPGRSG